MTDTTLYDEAQLFRRMASGEEKAFAEVYRTYFDPVYYYARRFLDNDQDAEDIASTVFQKLWVHRGEPFESVTHLKAFLYAITRNDCLNHIKLLKRRTERELEVIRRLEGWEEDAFASHEFIAEMMKQVDMAIESLPPQAARIFKLAYLEGKNNHEIAAMLDINEHTVRNQKSHALRLLRMTFRVILLFVRL
ncbi:MAG TPA: sigma-70 family RNA polymerase sigma factor [Chitinophagaceae bacterium]|nr:sigma-70 family RNA polymerase sigma factor [Chitinophagaceae bacterium]